MKRDIAIIPAGAVGDDRLGAYQLRVLAAFGSHVAALGEVGEVTDVMLAEAVEGSWSSHRRAIDDLVDLGWLELVSAEPTGALVARGTPDLRYRFRLRAAKAPAPGEGAGGAARR